MQNLSYVAQLRARKQEVCELMIHNGKFFFGKELDSLNIVKPIVPCDIQFHHLNRVREELNLDHLGFDA